MTTMPCPMPGCDGLSYDDLPYPDDAKCSECGFPAVDHDGNISAEQWDALSQAKADLAAATAPPTPAPRGQP